jgi:hypothetical protein
MSYWYIKVQISELIDKAGVFGKDKWSKPKTIAGKVIGIGNTGFYGSHPCYMVVTKEGKSPSVEGVLMDSSETDDCKHQILELRYVK